MVTGEEGEKLPNVFPYRMTTETGGGGGHASIIKKVEQKFRDGNYFSGQNLHLTKLISDP